MTSSSSRAGERFLHILNLDGFDKTFHIVENEQALFAGRILKLRSRDSHAAAERVRMPTTSLMLTGARRSPPSPSRRHRPAR
jgi:beta-galactosidase